MEHIIIGNCVHIDANVTTYSMTHSLHLNDKVEPAWFI